MRAIDIIAKRKELWERDGDADQDKRFVEAAAEYLMREESDPLRQEIRNFPEYIVEMFFSIVDKNMTTVPFFLNEVQHSFINDVNQAKRDYRDGKRNSLKFLILKGRQQGFTSVITAYQLANAIINKNFSGFTLADKTANTNTIFENKAKYLYNRLPDSIKPTEKYNNRREFHFDNINSRWEVDTAGSNGVGRSKTVNFFHGSEAAFWKSIEEIMMALGEALTKDSIQILETTANGLNEYKDLWDGAELGENNWDPKFYEWWLTPEYVLDFESSEHEREFKRNVEEANTDFFKKLNRLRNLESLEWEQLYWYYGKYKDLKDKLSQEYPCTAEEAFLASGNPVFDVDVLMEYLKHAKPGIRGKIVDGQFKQYEQGKLEVWSYPKSGQEYYIGGDVAFGLPNGDYSAAPVFDEDKNLVALWHGKIAPDLFGKSILAPLGYYYNTAMLVIEDNNHGLSTINAIKDDYPNIYMRTTHDKITDEEKKELGWHTDTKTKPLAINNLAALIRDRQLGLKSEVIIKEMLKYVEDENGKTNASSGHDDTVMASAIVLYAMNQFVSFTNGDIVNPYGDINMNRPIFEKLDRGFKHVSEVETEEEAFFRLNGW